MGKFSIAFSQLSMLLGIQWAPMNIPMSRRLQTLAVFGLTMLSTMGEITCVLLFIKLLYSRFWWIALLYGVWMLNDIDICNRGGRPSQWVMNWKLWRYVRDYFPIKLIKTVDLDPSRNYVFACHPHGILCYGIFGTFTTNASNFPKLFPGMMRRIVTLGGNFLVPLFREICLAFGYCAVSERSLLYLLDDKKYQGNCVCMCPGGAAEALDSHPREHKLTLSKRKGFVHVAIKSGAPLVPVYIFGETDLYNTNTGLLRRFQEKLQRLTGVAPVIFYGRGIFQYSYGLLPFRIPVTVVVGAPLDIKKNAEPTNDEIETIHAEFIQRLKTLFETEKAKYLKYHEDAQLVIT